MVVFDHFYAILAIFGHIRFFRVKVTNLPLFTTGCELVGIGFAISAVFDIFITFSSFSTLFGYFVHFGHFISPANKKCTYA